MDIERKSTKVRVGDDAFSYTVRPMLESDLPLVVEYRNSLEALEPADGEEAGNNLQELKERWHDPRSACTLRWVAQLGGESHEYGRIIAEAECEKQDNEAEAWGDFTVHPDYRHRGLGSNLYHLIEKSANSRLAKVLNVEVSQHHELKRNFLEQRGFEFDRYWWRMRLPADQQVVRPHLPQGYVYRTFVRDQDEALFQQVQNTTFADHFGTNLYTLAIATYMTRQDSFRPEGLFFIFKGGAIAGYCWAEINEEEIARRNVRVGWIEHLGVIPSERGKGLGRTLLLFGVNYLRQYVSIVELIVEGKNEKAMSLYRSVGFYTQKSWVNLRKSLPMQSDG